MNFKILNERLSIKSRAFNIQKVDLHLPDDRTTTYDLVDHNDSITVVPFDQDGNIWFVRQYRLGAQQIAA